MSYCPVHKNQSTKNKNNSKLSHCDKSEKIQEKIIGQHSCPKISKNGQRISFNTKAYLNSISNNSANAFENCSHDQQVSASDHCKIHNKNKKISAADCQNCQANCKQCSCSTHEDTHNSIQHDNNCTKSNDKIEEVTASTSSVANTKCQYCLNNTKTLETSAAHIDCKYCLGNTSNKQEMASKRSLPHTDCKYCLKNSKNTFKRSVRHTDCKYCLNNINNKKVTSKFSLPHTDCKYCLNPTIVPDQTTSKISTNTTNSNSLEELLEETSNFNSMNERAFASCLLHGDLQNLVSDLRQPYLYPLQSYYYPTHHRKSTSFRGNRGICNVCEHPSFCLVNDDSADIAAHIKEQIISDRRSHEYSMHTSNSYTTNTQVKFTSCDFCMKNGEPDVIYNSHQFRNGFGIITCPLLKQYICPTCDITGDFHHYPSDFEEIAVDKLHSHYLPPYAEMPVKRLLNCPTVNGCCSCPLLAAQSISTSSQHSPESSLEMPCFVPLRNKHTSFVNNYYSDEDLLRQSACTTRNCCNANHVSDVYRSPPTLNKCDNNNDFLKCSQPTITTRQPINNFANIRKPKKSVSCQFCLTTGEPPFIYNSHELRDETGITLQCPILKERANMVTGNTDFTCNGCVNKYSEKAGRFPLISGICNGSLTKRQYLNLIDCLM